MSDILPHLGFQEDLQSIYNREGTIATIFYGHFHLMISFGTDHHNKNSTECIEPAATFEIRSAYSNSNFGPSTSAGFLLDSDEDVFNLFEETAREYISRFRAIIIKDIDIDYYLSSIMEEFNKWKDELIIEEVIK